MSDTRPRITNARGTRTFDCFAAAILVFVVDEHERILMLSHPRHAGGWEVINGGLEHGDTILSGALRELREEAGPHVSARPLGTIHVYTHRYDDNIPDMISISYLMAYEGGEVVPGDDMAGSVVRWFTLAEIEAEQLIAAPRQRWMYHRAVELYRLWRDQPVPSLEKAPHEHGPKYGT